MPNLTNIPLVISSSSGRSKKSNASELINLYIHLEDAGSKSKSLLLHTPGSERIAVFDYPILGFYSFKNVLYAVTKSKLYRVVPTGVMSEFTIETVGNVELEDKVSFADNGTEMVFVSGGGYAYNPTTDTLKNMEDESGWYPSNTVGYLDGYFIFNRNETGQFFISKLFSTELDAIDWATGEAAPDDTLAVAVANRQLWIIGEHTSEVWYDSGDPLFPFTRIPGAVIDVGCINYRTVSKALDTIVFIGNDLKVYRTNGYSLIPISSQAIEFQISETCKACSENMKAFSFHERGRWFYALTLGGDHTYVYDMQTSLWHTRKSDDIGRWKMEGIYNNYADGLNYGYSTNYLYLVSEDLYQEDDKNILREIVSLPLNDTVNRVRISELELDMEVALNEEAEIALQISNDAGRSWSSKNFSKTGATGESRSRVKWRRLGQHRNIVAKFSSSSPVPFKILSLHIRRS